MLLSRCYSSAIILAVFFSIILLKGITGLIVFIFAGIFVSIVVVREFSSILFRLGLNKYQSINELLAAFVFLVFVFRGFYESEIDLGILLLVVLLVCLWLKILFSINNKEEILKIFNLVIVFVLLIIPLNFITLIFMQDYGASYIGLKLVVFLVLVTKFSDIGAYSIGTLTSNFSGGNHKITPSISPKKSWEGIIGGTIIAVIVSMIICYFYELSMGIAIIFGVVLSVGGFIGDLAESSLKRSVNIKDSGNIIPGIGGVLDLLDSLLINAPLFYIILIFLGMINYTKLRS